MSIDSAQDHSGVTAILLFSLPHCKARRHAIICSPSSPAKMSFFQHIRRKVKQGFPNCALNSHKGLDNHQNIELKPKMHISNSVVMSAKNPNEYDSDRMVFSVLSPAHPYSRKPRAVNPFLSPHLTRNDVTTVLLAKRKIEFLI